jgi:hypothetical protein
MSSPTVGWHVRPTSAVLSAQDPRSLDNLLYLRQAVGVYDAPLHRSRDSAMRAAREQWARAVEEHRDSPADLARINKCLLILAAERARDFHKAQGERPCVAGHLVGDDPYVSSWERLGDVYEHLVGTGSVERLDDYGMYRLRLR